MRDRKDGPLRPASWDEALDRIAGTIQATQEASAWSGRDLRRRRADQREELHAGQVRPRGAADAHIDYNGRFCMASAAAAGIKAFGMDRGMPFPLEDIPQTDVILLVGGNPAESLPVMMQYFEEQQRRGGRLIVVDPGSPRPPRGDAASADHAGNRRRARQRPAQRRDPEGSARLRLHRRRGRRGSTPSAVPSPPTGPTGWSGSPAFRPRRSRMPRA